MFFPDKATVDLLFSFLPTFNTVVVWPSLSLNEAVPGPVLANRYVHVANGQTGTSATGVRGEGGTLYEIWVFDQV